MARTQFTFTFTNAQPGSVVRFDANEQQHVFTAATGSAVLGHPLILNSSNSITVWTDASVLTAITEDGAGNDIAATATTANPSVTTADGTPGQNPYSAAYATVNEAPTSPERYGTVGSGDDTAAFTALNAALPATGGEVRLGGVTYDLPNGFTFTKQVTIVGRGGGQNINTLTAPTILRCSSRTASALTLNAIGSQVRSLAIQNTAGSAPTAGAGVSAPQGDSFLMDDVSIRGFWILADIYGWYWKLLNCNLTAPVKYGVQISNSYNPDLGDSSILGTNILADTYQATAGIHYLGGGGFKMANTKINATNGTGANNWTHGILAEIASGVATGQFQVANCSIENWATHAVDFEMQGGSFGSVMFDNVQTGSYLAGAQEAFLLNATASSGLSNVSLSNITSQRLPFVAGGNGYPMVTANYVNGLRWRNLQAYGYRANPVNLSNITAYDFGVTRSDYPWSGAGDSSTVSRSFDFPAGTPDRYINVNVGDVIVAEWGGTFTAGGSGGALGTLHLGFMFQGGSNTTIEGTNVTELGAGNYQVNCKVKRVITSADIRSDGSVRVLPMYYKTAGTAYLVNSGGVLPWFSVTNYGSENTT